MQIVNMLFTFCMTIHARRPFGGYSNPYRTLPGGHRESVRTQAAVRTLFSFRWLALLACVLRPVFEDGGFKRETEKCAQRVARSEAGCHLYFF